MVAKIMVKLKQLFCKHEYEILEMENQYVNYDGSDFSDVFKMISVKCKKCEKTFFGKDLNHIK